MGSVSNMVDNVFGYEGMTSELKLFYVFGTNDNQYYYDNDGYMQYLKSVKAYEQARLKYPLGAAIEDERAYGKA